MTTDCNILEVLVLFELNVTERPHQMCFRIWYELCAGWVRIIPIQEKVKSIVQLGLR